MKTVITKKVDGFDIVVGFSELSIEPVETNKIVSAEIVNTPEFKACAEKKDKINASRRLAQESVDKCKAAKKGSAEEKKHYADFLVFNEQANGYEKELLPLNENLKNKIAALKKSNAVYFEPKAGEIVKSEAEILVLKGLLKTTEGRALVDIDGNIVPDKRGTVYCQNNDGKWSVTQIVALGNSVPEGAIIYTDLDTEQKKAVDLQIEINQAANLSAVERLAMKGAEEEKALANAANLRSRLEIKGDADSLIKSQDFYNARLQEIGLIYGSVADCLKVKPLPLWLGLFFVY